MNRDSDKARRDLAFFSMKPNDKKEFLKFVSSVKFPNGYASNIARCVNVDGGKFTGLKSHDCHVFMQSLLPVGIQHLLSEDVVKPIMLLSRFFSQLTAKTLRKTDMFQLRHDIVQVLCKFEMIFPPAFFTSMMHVMVHLPEEALLTGPVNYRWMYLIERLLGELKKSVRNRAKPEGSILEAWVQYESLTFCGISATKVVPRSFPTITVESAALSSSVFTESAPPSFSLLWRPNQTLEMSDLIRRRRAVTTTQSSEPPALPTSAATALALMDHLAVGPAGSQAPAVSASSVAQPVSARHLHRPTSTTDTTFTDASGSQLGPCRQLKKAKVTWVTNSRINIGYDEQHRAAPTAELHSSLAHDIGHVIRSHCPMKWKSWTVMPDETKTEVHGQLSMNYNLEDLDDESLAYVNRLFSERYKQWKSDLHHSGRLPEGA
ncbi:hypothetical protein L3X38_018355 [Prunus dulcis]|uniref:DUF4218 domain-containing protein n=1 Tax=Prunus dulcis TaxID=3755 RepID=A0AAD4ZBJ6_PRUDU|nr:hypothetical protein L3X38_018355 [Prunus dulcis]